MNSLPEDQNTESTPYVIYALVALNVILYLWDRNGNPFGQSVVFADLAYRPREVLDAITGKGDSFALAGLFTSMFLHGSLLHIIGNMIYLVTFGGAIENAIGSARFALYYLFWGLVASAAHIYVDPGSAVPTLGASGAIGGILGCFLLLFPSYKIELVIPFFAFSSVDIPAWILLGGWFLFQVLVPQAGVANWAHVGGFLAGMVTVLILGGRTKILKDQPLASMNSV